MGARLQENLDSELAGMISDSAANLAADVQELQVRHKRTERHDEATYSA